jgi:hypothetical protein
MRNALALANIIDRWNYDKSVEKMRPLVKQWKHATKEMLRELYLAREFIACQREQYKGKKDPDYLVLSWSEYCGEIGLPYQTANNWLRDLRFTPGELSPTGRDALMLFEAPAKEDTTADRALLQARVNEVLRTGERPTDWTDEEEAEVKRQMKNAQFAELVEKYGTPAMVTKTDYFAEAMRHSKDIVNFKLENRVQHQAQIKIFRYIEAYLSIFDDPEIRARAALNLALKTRNLANELAEQNFQLQESAGGGA